MTENETKELLELISLSVNANREIGITPITDLRRGMLSHFYGSFDDAVFGRDYKALDEILRRLYPDLTIIWDELEIVVATKNNSSNLVKFASRTKLVAFIKARTTLTRKEKGDLYIELEELEVIATWES